MSNPMDDDRNELQIEHLREYQGSGGTRDLGATGFPCGRFQLSRAKKSVPRKVRVAAASLDEDLV